MTDDKENRILAFDYGAKRIGIALSDPLKTFAYPHITINNNNKTWNELDKLLTEKNISKIILGYPFRDDGKLSSISPKIMKFKEELEKRYKLEVILWDERYTSSIAAEMMISSTNKRSKRRDKGIIDRNAAAIILQEYLNEHKLKG
jgi:putative Holliday junction resolvase